ncbi:hypothetical protein, partial [Gemmobacter caeruleus]|uniref:hypothetical protein n=1 Tax=Gemmobacter caeruleus TaxID=2595004 RepID=UPI00193A9D63
PSPLRNKTHKREADTHIIAEASEPICKRPPSKTTKPPAYPFIPINVKERGNNRLGADFSAFPTGHFRFLHRRFVSVASVRRYLGGGAGSRKSKKAKNREKTVTLLCNPLFHWCESLPPPAVKARGCPRHG